jgi:1-acyl-sn-glycerol-3-phosphate acyltransferase
MKIIYDLLLRFLFIIGYYTKCLKNGKNYEFSYDEETKNNIIKAFNNKKLLIVSNHMTLIDSVLIQLFILKIFGWFGFIKNNFRQILWNLPAKENMDLLRNHSSKVGGFLYSNVNRMLPIDRLDQDSSLKTLDEAKQIIIDGGVFIMFPEAGRTRRNEFNQEDMTPGAAKLLLDIEKESGSLPGLLTIYVRAEDQLGHSNLPSSTKIKIFAEYNEDFQIKSDHSSIRKRKNLTIFIGKSINKLQEQFYKMN